MPVIDTMVLFATADTQHKWHKSSKKALELVNRDNKWLVPSFALMEFDLTLKSRSFTSEERMNKYSLLMLDYPNLNTKVYPITPAILHETSRIEELYDLDYFDAGMVATSLNWDGQIATIDKQILKISEIEGVLEQL